MLACNIADRSVMGNVYSQTLQEVWRSAKAEAYRNDTLPICMKDLLLKLGNRTHVFAAASQ